jgi:integrative and conjugative element protein (TIGR02256 family)
VSDESLEWLGPCVDPAQLSAPKARALAGYLTSERIAEARLIETRQSGTVSSVIIEVDVEVGQQPKCDIRRQECFAVLFDLEDNAWPEVLALRPDFPRNISHLNLRLPGSPVSLCLSDQPYEEAKAHWSAAGLIAATREWLSLTARGELHLDDQPLEPFVMGFQAHLIIPQQLLTRDQELPNLLYGYQSPGQIGSSASRPVYQLFEQPIGGPVGPPQFSAALLISPPRLHGVIHSAPRTLADLHALLRNENFHLLDLLKDRLNVWKGNVQCLDTHPILLIGIPAIRHAGGPVEQPELWAFLLEATVSQIGERLDLWQVQDGKLGIVLRPDTSRSGDDVGVSLLNPHLTLSRIRASQLNGASEWLDPGVVVAVGAGALGSQVLINLARGGIVCSVIIDHDQLLPHNLAHHALTGSDLGLAKAVAVARDCRLLIDEDPAPVPMAVNVLRPEREADNVKAKFREANVILDMSASVAVARHLALDTESPARRISLFLNPSGSDLVVLAEDNDRTIALDQIEMQYYRALITDERLANHLNRPDRIRYGRSCRDLSSRISNVAVTIHAAIGADASRKILKQADAAALIWRLDENDCSLNRIPLEVQRMREFYVAGFAVFVNELLVEMLHRQRTGKLPNETDGVLIGDCDMQRRRIYLIGSIAAPPDSIEWPTHYIRGSRGLRKQVDTISERTDGMLRYLGEWHSHPDGFSSDPSSDDQTAYRWLAQHMIVEGYPPVMLIVGDRGDIRCMIGDDSAALPR